jgi:guanylate kinase
MDTTKTRSTLLALCGPSGVGKSSIVRSLINTDKKLLFSVAATTRQPRPGEIEARVYRFVSEAEFRRLLLQGELLEHDERFGNLYGELREPVVKALAKNIDVLFDTDYAGARNIAAAIQQSVVTIGLLPPSLSELRRRLVDRGNLTEQELERRINQAESFMNMAQQCDYVLVNDDLNATICSVGSILTKERNTRHKLMIANS